MNYIFVLQKKPHPCVSFKRNFGDIPKHQEYSVEVWDGVGESLKTYPDPIKDLGVLYAVIKMSLTFNPGEISLDEIDHNGDGNPIYMTNSKNWSDIFRQPSDH